MRARNLRLENGLTEIHENFTIENFFLNFKTETYFLNYEG
jgi:hypothetical protein